LKKILPYIFNALTPALRQLKPVIAAPVVRILKKRYSTLLKHALTVFVFHDVSDNPSEFSRKCGLNVSVEVFDFQIKFIKEHFNITSPDDLLGSNIPEKAALITFDDGFESFFKSAIPVLEKFNAPCIHFLNMGPIQGEIFWSGLTAYLCEKRPDFIQYLKENVHLKDNSLPPTLICSKENVETFLKAEKKEMRKEVENFTGKFATLDLLEKSTKHELVVYGNHLYNHFVPLLMSDEELINSFRKNAEELKQFPNFRNVFSFPYGQPGSCFSQDQVDLLIENGAEKVFRSSGNINSEIYAPYLDRIGLSSYHFSSNRIWFQVMQQKIKNLFSSNLHLNSLVSGLILLIVKGLHASTL